MTNSEEAQNQLSESGGAHRDDAAASSVYVACVFCAIPEFAPDSSGVDTDDIARR